MNHLVVNKQPTSDHHIKEHEMSRERDLTCSINHWHAGFDAILLVDPSFHRVQLNPAATALVKTLHPDEEGEQAGLKIIEFFKRRGILNNLPASNIELCYHKHWLLANICQTSDRACMFVIRDIHHTKSDQQRINSLKEANTELNEIFDLSADGLVTIDHKGMILRINKAYEKIVGLKAEDFIGKPASSIKDEGYLPDLVSMHVLRNLQHKNIFVTINGKDVLMTGYPVFNEHGNLIRIIANIRDLTELNRLKDELNKYHELTNRYETEIHHLRAQELKAEIIGHSTGVQRMLQLATQASKVDSTVLIGGETGTGKEILAKTIHKLGKNNEGPFIAVNCSALPESLIESELFGYKDGAFTGAQKGGKIGLFEAAQKGTLFLDEISEMPITTQVKLLRAIQERKIRPVGSNEEKEIDLRILAASNKDLKERVHSGRFREDLYYRLNVISITIPPLRERQEDIPLLANHFLNKFNRKFDRKKKLTQKILAMLLKHDWPGNIRELENAMERLVVLNDHLFLDSGLSNTQAETNPKTAPETITLKTFIEEKEKELIQKTYEECRSTRKTAKRLQISQATVVRKLNKHRKLNTT